jgi:hypothetical protein
VDFAVPVSCVLQELQIQKSAVESKLLTAHLIPKFA